MTLDSLQAFSANANLHRVSGTPPILTFPLLQGMGFITAIYNGCTPLIQSSVFFRDVQPAGLFNNGATGKYRILLEDGKTWLLYVTTRSGSPRQSSPQRRRYIARPHVGVAEGMGPRDTTRRGGAQNLKQAAEKQPTSAYMNLSLKTKNGRHTFNINIWMMGWTMPFQIPSRTGVYSLSSSPRVAAIKPLDTSCKWTVVKGSGIWSGLMDVGKTTRA